MRSLQRQREDFASAFAASATSSPEQQEHIKHSIMAGLAVLDQERAQLRAAGQLLRNWRDLEQEEVELAQGIVQNIMEPDHSDHTPSSETESPFEDANKRFAEALAESVAASPQKQRERAEAIAEALNGLGNDVPEEDREAIAEAVLESMLSEDSPPVEEPRRFDPDMHANVFEIVETEAKIIAAEAFTSSADNIEAIHHDLAHALAMSVADSPQKLDKYARVILQAFIDAGHDIPEERHEEFAQVILESYRQHEAATAETLEDAYQPPALETWLSAMAAGNAKFRETYCPSKGLAIVPNSGTGNNCLILSLLQHATGKYDRDSEREHAAMAENIREILAQSPEWHSYTDEYGMLLADKKHEVFQLLVGMINDQFGTNMNVFVVQANHNGKPFVEDLSDHDMPDATNVVLYQSGLHFEALVTQEAYDASSSRRKEAALE